MTEQTHYFYSYAWKRKEDREYKNASDVFRGTFDQLVEHTLSQPEQWVIIFAKEISEDTYAQLEDHL